LNQGSSPEYDFELTSKFTEENDPNIYIPRAINEATASKLLNTQKTLPPLYRTNREIEYDMK
jgi:hypothetical protein